MSLPPFIERALDAAGPALGHVGREQIRERLAQATVSLRVAYEAGDSNDVGARLAANLLARLYGRIELDVPARLAEPLRAEMVAINPDLEIVDASGETVAELTIGTSAEVDARRVCVFASSWNVYVDDVPTAELPPAQAPAALAAATLGVAAVFRVVFAAELAERGRSDPEPASLNLVTLRDAEAKELPPPTADLGRLRLVGAGAIGQAATLTLAESGSTAELAIIDPEAVEFSNLQRYLLTRPGDVGRPKVDLLASRLRDTVVEVAPVPTPWSHAVVAGESLPTLVALDSAEARIGVQASLPGPIYNAWTQPADLGFSRHEHFGEEPCLACLYWPIGAAPSRYEQIAEALGQHPLRILSYLVHGFPVGAPLPIGAVPQLPELQPPPEAAEWHSRPLIDDIAAAADVAGDELDGWRERPVGDLYQEGICGGALLYLDMGDAPQEVVVPLAHQSALAGIMLATQALIAASPELAARRPEAVEARCNVLGALPQVFARPRSRTDGCLCADEDFAAASRANNHGPDD